MPAQQYFGRMYGIGYYFWKFCHLDWCRIYLPVTQTKPIFCTGCTNCIKFPDCAICLEVWISGAFADSIYDADCGNRRNHILRYFGYDPLHGAVQI